MVSLALSLVFFVKRHRSNCRLDEMELQLTKLRQALNAVYGPQEIEEIVQAVVALADTAACAPATPAVSPELTQNEAVLICYADSVRDASRLSSPLSALTSIFQECNWGEVFPIVHLLPFYPWDTDRGFSVCNYYEVAPENGSWADIAALSHFCRLMFDFVANHASIDNPLIQAALIERHLLPDDPRAESYLPYRDFVIAFDDESRPSAAELSQLTRPRAAPVLTPYFVFEQDDELRAELGVPLENLRCLGTGYVWTTFSRGVDGQGVEHTRQVDLNYRNPRVFIEVLRVLLFYVHNSASLIRLDAIGYLWKQLGSASIHEPQTHQLLQALYIAMELLAPDCLSVAEVNEPQEKVFTYLGPADAPEADLVYQFSHFPLAVHALFREDGTFYRQWLTTTAPAAGRQFVTVLGSHDGMGLKPLRGILPEDEIEDFSRFIRDERGALPNFAKLSGGKEIIYELCATAWSLINGNSSAPFAEQLARYKLVVSLGLASQGLPAIYLHSFLGVESYFPSEGLDENRTVNRRNFSDAEVRSWLYSDSSREKAVSSMICDLLAHRSHCPAFHPTKGALQVYGDFDPRIIAVRRDASEQHLLLLHNVSSTAVPVSVPTSDTLRDVLTGDLFEPESGNTLTLLLQGFECRWLEVIL